MAWNRPTENNSLTNRKVERCKINFAVVSGIVGTVICALLAGWWAFRPDAVKTHDRLSKSKRICNVEKAKTKHQNLPKKRAVVKTGNKVNDSLAEIEAAVELIKIRRPLGIKHSGMTNQVFTTCVEQVMSFLTMVEPGELPMPIPHLDAEDRAELINALISKNEIKEGDSEKVAYAKESVGYLKKEMIKYIKGGGDPDDFLQYYSDQLHQANDTRDEVANMYHEIQETNPEDAERFLEKANKLLEDKGIKVVESDEESDKQQEARPASDL